MDAWWEGCGSSQVGWRQPLQVGLTTLTRFKDLRISHLIPLQDIQCFVCSSTQCWIYMDINLMYYIIPSISPSNLLIGPKTVLDHARAHLPLLSSSDPLDGRSTDVPTAACDQVSDMMIAEMSDRLTETSRSASWLELPAVASRRVASRGFDQPGGPGPARKRGRFT